MGHVPVNETSQPVRFPIINHCQLTLAATSTSVTNCCQLLHQLGMARCQVPCLPCLPSAACWFPVWALDPTRVPWWYVQTIPPRVTKKPPGSCQKPPNIPTPPPRVCTKKPPNSYQNTPPCFYQEKTPRQQSLPENPSNRTKKDPQHYKKNPTKNLTKKTPTKKTPKSYQPPPPNLIKKTQIVPNKAQIAPKNSLIWGGGVWYKNGGFFGTHQCPLGEHAR